MSYCAKYIQDAIKNIGPDSLVNVLIDGKVFQIQAKIAITEINKPKEKRSFGFKNINPIQDAIVKSIQIIQEPINVFLQESTEEPIGNDLKKKKKKKIK